MVENKNLTKEKIQKYRMMFGLIDQDGDNLISFDDLKNTFDDIGVKIDTSIIKEKMLSDPKDGKIDFNNFLNIVGPKFDGFSEESELKDAFATFASGNNNDIDSTLLKQNLLNLLPDGDKRKENISNVISEFTKENKITDYKRFEQDKFIDIVKQ
jgi:Ca2+-binding EF-hand superfamily protein